MDGKSEIRIAEEQEECVDLALSYSVCCSLYMCMIKGLESINKDLYDMTAYEAMIQKNTEIPEHTRKEIILKTQDQEGVAKLVKVHSEAFVRELTRVIKELEPKKENKVIIHKPNWNEKG